MYFGVLIPPFFCIFLRFYVSLGVIIQGHFARICKSKCKPIKNISFYQCKPKCTSKCKPSLNFRYFRRFQASREMATFSTPFKARLNSLHTIIEQRLQNTIIPPTRPSNGQYRRFLSLLRFKVNARRPQC